MKLNILRCWQTGFCFLVTLSCLAQNPSLDGLKHFLKQHPAKDSILVELAQANQQMGSCWQTVQPSEAIHYFKQSLEEYKEAGKKEEAVHVHQLIAASYYYLNDYEKQLFHLKRALQDALELNSAALEINLLHQISKVYCYLNNYESAMEFCLMALQESHNHNQWMLEEIMIGQAEIEFQKGNFQTSMELNNKALARVSEKEQKQLEMTCLCNIAGCLIELKRYNYARMILRKCMAISHPDDDSDNYRALQLMTVVESKTGNFKTAFQLQRQLEQITAKKHSLEQLKKTSDTVLQAEMEQLNRKLTCLQTIYHEQNSQTAQTNTLLIVLIVAAGGGVFFFAIVKHSFKSLKLEKIQFTNEQTTIVEKQNSLSSKYQSLLQKKDTLQDINNSLTVLNRAKTELFKAISHDLQTPLIQLQQNLTHLMNGMSEDQFRQATAGLTNKVGDISLLLENLLQWSKFQSQGIQAKPQYTDLTALLNDVVDIQKYSAAEKKINLTNALDQRIFVYADEEMVKTLLKTILQNIVKLSEPDATIAISGNKDKQNGWLQINYTGQMPLKQTFLQQSQTANYGSKTTELGKAIILGWMLCRTLVKINNGSINVEDISDESFQVDLRFPLEGVKV